MLIFIAFHKQSSLRSPRTLYAGERRFPLRELLRQKTFKEGRKGRGGGCRARFTEIKIENSRFTGVKTDFSRIVHNSTFALILHP